MTPPVARTSPTMGAALPIILVATVAVVLFPPIRAANPWDGLGYNPWEKWNVFALKPGGIFNVRHTTIVGRVGSAGDVDMRDSHVHTDKQSDEVPSWSISAGGKLTLKGPIDVWNGGVEAGGDVVASAQNGQANLAWGAVKSVGGSVTLQNTAQRSVQYGIGIWAKTTAKAVQTTSGVTTDVPGAHINSGATMSVDLAATAAFFVQQSADYAALPDYFESKEFDANAKELRVVLKKGRNVISMTASEWAPVEKIVLIGNPTATLIINFKDTITSLSLKAGLLVGYKESAAGEFSPFFTSGRVLLNLVATDYLHTSPSSNLMLSILAPNTMLYTSGGLVLSGNIIVGWLNGEDQPEEWSSYDDSAIFRVLTWALGKAPPPTVESLGYNPWERWSLFMVGGADPFSGPNNWNYGSFEGRIAVLADIQIVSATVHATKQSDFPFSISAGGNIQLVGVTVENGGVEALGNLMFTEGSVAGDVKSVNGDVTFYQPSPTVAGTVFAKTQALVLPDYSAIPGASINSGATMGVDLAKAAAYFVAQSEEYAEMPVSRDSMEIAGEFSDVLLVGLHAGSNVITLTKLEFDYLSKIVLSGSATATLIINVKYEMEGFSLNIIGLKVVQKEADGTEAPLTKGRVLLNAVKAGTINVMSGMGPDRVPLTLSILAPKATLTLDPNQFFGSYVVARLNAMSSPEDFVELKMGTWEFGSPSAAGPDEEEEEPGSTTPPPTTPPPTTPPPTTPPPTTPPPTTTTTDPNDCAWSSSLGFNPWDRWDVYTLDTCVLGGTSGTAAEDAVVVEGRVCGAGGVTVQGGSEVHTAAQKPRTRQQRQSAATNFSVTSGKAASVIGAGGTKVVRGGVEAVENVIVSGSGGNVVTVGGGVRSFSGTVSLSNKARVQGEAKARTLPTVAGDGSQAVGGVVAVAANGETEDEIVEAVGLSVDVSQASAYYTGRSAYYQSLESSFLALEVKAGGDEIVIRVHGRVNVVNSDDASVAAGGGVSAAQLRAAKRLVLVGHPAGVVVFNVKGGKAGDGIAAGFAHALSVVYKSTAGATVAEHPPTFGRVIVNYFEAEAVEASGLGQDADGAAVTSGVSVSILAPLAALTLNGGGVLKGSVVAKSVVASGQVEVHHQPWGSWPAKPGAAPPRAPRPPGAAAVGGRLQCLWRAL